MKEKNIQSLIMVALSKLGAIIFRNNTGKAWVGEVVHKDSNTITLRNYRVFHAGLHIGSSDLIGITPIVITHEMVGQTVGVFTAVEVKAEKGKTSDSQKAFINAIQKAGGLAGTAKNIDEAKKIIGK